MNSRKALVCAVTLFCSAVFSARAQKLLVTPGSSSSSTTVSVFSTNPFAAANSITAPAGTFYAVANPGATRYYLLSTAGVSVVNASTGAQIASLSTPLPATAEAISPDGSKLLIGSGNSAGGAVALYDLSSNPPALVANLPLSSQALDVATSPDSARGYVLTLNDITLVDLGTGVIGTPVTLNNVAPSGSATPKISVAPDSMVYVSANSALYRLNPRNLALSKTFATAGYPGKLTFAPDGTSAAAVNQLSGSSRVFTVFDLTGATSGNSLDLSGVGFSQAVYVDNQTVWAVSAGNGSLYSMPADSPHSVSVPEFPGFGSITNSRGVVKSSEFDPQSNYAPKNIFVIGSDAVYRLDSPDSTPDQVSVAGLGGPAFYFAPVMTSGTPASLIVYNPSQDVGVGGTARPVGLRVLDSAGRPLANQPVTWYGGSVTLQSAMTVTNSDGIAIAYAVVPSTEESYSITATVASALTTDFTLNVGASSGDDGGGGGDGGDGSAASGISIVSGNGQVVGQKNPMAPNPLVVYVHDPDGNPVSNATVTFAIADGEQGAITSAADSCSGDTSGQTIACHTDSNGIASVTYVAPTLSAGLGYTQTTVTASIPAQNGNAGGSVNFIETNPSPDPFLGQAMLPLILITAPQSSPVSIQGQAGQRLTGAIQFTTATQGVTFAGQPIPNIGIEVQPGKSWDETVTSPATCGTGVQLTNSNGVGACDLVLGNTPGTYSMYAIIGGFYPLPFTLTITAAPATATTITKTNGDNQSGTTGSTLPNPLTVVVKDQSGQAMSGVTVTFTVTSGSASLSSTSATTNASGVASTNVTLGSTPGAVVVKASAGDATPVTFNLTATVQLTSLTKVAGDNQTVVIGSDFPALTVQVAPPVQGVLVAFAVTSGNATMSDGSAVTDASGKAGTTVTAGMQPGAVTVTATVNGLPAQTFNLIQRMPGPAISKASFLNGASFLQNITHGAIVAIVGDGITSGIAAGICVTGGDGVGPLPTRVAGIEVTFGGTLSPIFHVCRTTDGKDQVTVQVPFDLGVPSNTLAVVRTGAGTAAQQDTVVDGIPVLPSAPGIFEYTPTATSGRISVAVRPDGSFVSPSNPALKGETIRLYTTGLGVSLPNAKTNQPGIPGQVLFQTAAVNVGGQGASGVTAEYAQNMIGVFVVTFQVPSNPTVSNGVATLTVTVADAGQTFSSQTSAIPIQ